MLLRGPNVIRVLLLLELNVADSCSLPPTCLVFWPPACHEDNVINYPGRSGSPPRRPSARPQHPVVDNAEAYLVVSLCFFCKPQSPWGEASTVPFEMSSGALTDGTQEVYITWPFRESWE